LAEKWQKSPVQAKHVRKDERTYWQVDLRSQGLGRVWDKSRAEALKNAANKIAGVHDVVFTDADRAAKKRLGNYSLAEAVDFFLAHRPTAARTKLSDAVALFLKEQRGRAERNDLRPKYVDALEITFSQFERFLPAAAHCDEVPTSTIEKWLSHRAWAAETRTAMLSRLRTFFEWCRRRGFVTVSPCDNVAAIRVTKKPPHVWTVEEAGNILRAAKGDRPEMLPFLALGLFCGIRPEEIQRLTWANVDLKRSFVEVGATASKTRERRIVTLPANAKAWLKLGGELPTSNLRWRRRDLVKSSGVAWKADVMRHSFASYHLALHQSADRTAHELGHTNTKMLFRHYRNVVTPQAARQFWKLAP
jgi:integrase